MAAALLRRTLHICRVLPSPSPSFALLACGQAVGDRMRGPSSSNRPQPKRNGGLHGGERRQHTITGSAVMHSSLPSTPATPPCPSAPRNTDPGCLVLELFTTSPTK